MKSSQNPLRRLVHPFRQKSNSPRDDEQRPEVQTDASSPASDFDYEAERSEILAQEDPLLPDILAAVKDYQLVHGSLVKLTLHPATKHLPVAHTVLAHPIGVSLVPTLWPEERLHEVWDLQPVLQELYAKVSSDPEYLRDVLQDCISGEGSDDWSDEIISSLWKIYEEVRNDEDGLGHMQDVELSLCRGDWMLNIDSPLALQQAESLDIRGNLPELKSLPSLKQVELNTMATAGASHSHSVTRMHKHLLTTDTYSQLPSIARAASTAFAALPRLPPFAKLAPNNNGIQSFADALARAHSLYGIAKSGLAYRMCVLMLVEHNNVNIADERPIEYTLWEREPPVPCFRCEYRDVMTKTWFAPARPDQQVFQSNRPTGRELLFKPYSGDSPVFEVAVVYHRGSISVEELSMKPFPNPDSPHSGFEIRRHVERSRAIKCPSVLGQLASSKKVQHHLSSAPGAMERFIGTEAAQRLRDRSMPMYPLADPAGHLRQILDECIPPPNTKPDSQAFEFALKAAELALAKYVLKPIGAEGGGHCIFGTDIPSFYTEVVAPANAQAGYILMERIHPPVVRGALISQRGYHVGPVVSELGILGACLWRRTGDRWEGSRKGNGDFEILSNESVGWTLKSKPEEVQEMSVIRGYGCFDTPCLVSEAMYMAEAREGAKEW